MHTRPFLEGDKMKNLRISTYRILQVCVLCVDRPILCEGNRISRRGPFQRVDGP